MDIKQKIEKVYISLMSAERPKLRKLGYKKTQEDNNIVIYRRNIIGRKIVASYDTMVVASDSFKKNMLLLYPDVHSNYHKRIKFNTKNFPGLISGSHIDQVMLLPYMRQLDNQRICKAIRLVVITDKCQVFHNCPARRKDCDGDSIYNDDIRFEESAVWDIPEHKYPSKEINASGVEKYYPYLPDAAYEYHPVLNTDSSYKDEYGNGGFGKTHKAIVKGKEVEVGRFYFPKRTLFANSLHHIGGEEPDYKMTIIGTYRANNGGAGARTVIFATTDGGRNWFAKYEFGDLGTYQFSQGVADWRTGYGNPICIGKEDFSATSFYIRKRTVILPSEQDKEPDAYFDWGDPLSVVSLEQGQKTLRVKTEKSHHIETGNVVALQSTIDNPLSNNEVSATSGGNGTLYKAEVIDDFTVELYEYVHSSYNPICCRHIHQINRVKDGWLIGTGEVYPNGWLLYFQMKESDSYSEKHAWQEFEIFRLNSTPKSVQRTLGATLFDDKEQTLIYASDHDTLERSEIDVPEGRTFSIRRGSTGVFKGRLADIDDRNKYNIIYEAIEPSFMFKKIHGRLIFAGQRGELAICQDCGKRWTSYRIDTDMYHYYGSFLSSFVIGDYVIEFK